MNKTRQYIDAIQKAGIQDNPNRAQIIAITIAAKESSTVNIPTAPVKSIKIWYRDNALSEIKHRVNEVNEHITFDVSFCLKLIEQLVEIRYSFVHTDLGNRDNVMKAMLALAAYDNSKIPPAVSEVITGDDSISCIQSLSRNITVH